MTPILYKGEREHEHYLILDSRINNRQFISSPNTIKSLFNPNLNYSN
jgi:hypothetical protein